MEKIWENRNDVKLDLCQSPDDVFIQLKSINGFDVMEDGIPLDSFIQQYKLMVDKLRLNKGSSIFEVGCGCGANLYLFYQDGYTIGGMDYSNTLINTMKKVF